MIERRMAVTGLEMREDAPDGPTIEGYASTFDQPYDMGWYTETVASSAFNRTLKENPDVRLLINHDGLPLARTTSGTLRLEKDKVGLRMSAVLDGDDPDVQALIPKMKRGDLNQMSFGFRTTEDEWSKDLTRRTLRALDLNNGDVSVVTYPANPNTSAAIRGEGVRLDALSSALRELETREASEVEIVEFLTRALAAFGSGPVIAETIEVVEVEAVEETAPIAATRHLLKERNRRILMALDIPKRK